MGSTVALTGGLSAGGARMGAVRRGCMGCAGVPKAGDEEGIGFWATAEGFSDLLAVAIVFFMVSKVSLGSLVVV